MKLTFVEVLYKTYSHDGVPSMANAKHRLKSLRELLVHPEKRSYPYPEDVRHVPFQSDDTGSSLYEDARTSLGEVNDSEVVAVVLPNSSLHTRLLLTAISETATPKVIGIYLDSYSRTKWRVSPILDDRMVVLALSTENPAVDEAARFIRDQLILASIEIATSPSAIMIRNLVELQQSYWDWQNCRWNGACEQNELEDFSTLAQRLVPYVSFCKGFLGMESEAFAPFWLPLFPGNASSLIETSSDVIFELSKKEGGAVQPEKPKSSLGERLIDLAAKGCTRCDIEKILDKLSEVPPGMVSVFRTVIQGRDQLYSSELKRYCEVLGLLA